MKVYRVFYRNYEENRNVLLGTLVERRKDLRGMTEVASGLKWARVAFCRWVKDKHSIFVVPGESFIEAAKSSLEGATFTKMSVSTSGSPGPLRLERKSIFSKRSQVEPGKAQRFPTCVG